MRRLKWGYIYALICAAFAGSIGLLLDGAATRNLELSMLGSNAFFGTLALLLVALAFAWLTRARRMQGKIDELERERTKYYAARAVLDVEAERTANATEERERESDRILAADREALQREYAEKLCTNLAAMATTRTKEIKRSWLIGYQAGCTGLTEDAPDTGGGVLIPWPVPSMQGGAASGAGNYRN